MNGNSYSLGRFNATIDFDPGAGVANSIPNGTDAFLVKLDATGNYSWNKNFGDQGNALAFDASGNILTIGLFSSTSDFDPSAGTFSLINNGGTDVFLSTLSTTGNFVSAQRIGNASDDGANDIVVDPIGNIMVTGHFTNTVDFDPGLGTSNLTSTLASQNVSIFKLNSSKVYRWAKTFGGTRVVKVQSQTSSVTTDASGNVYSTGYYGGTVDFDQSSANVSLTATGTNMDMFVKKNDAAGNLIWVKSIGTAGNNEEGISIACDLNGLYIVGNYGGTVDFDPSVATFNLSGANDFVLKMDLNGNFQWAQNCNFNTVDIKLDATGNVIIAGSFSGNNVDFNQSVATFLMSSAGSRDVCIVKLSSTGTFIWAVKMGGSKEEDVGGIDIDANGNVYATGFFSGTAADFDPGAGVFNLTASNSDNQDSYIVKINTLGNYVWAYSFGQTTNDDEGISLDVSNDGFLYVLGTFKNTIDLDFSASTFNLTNASSISSFILKLNLNAGFIWAKMIDNLSKPSKINSDINGACYVTGTFSGTRDFDPGTSIYNLTSQGGNDVFIQKLDNSGVFSWAKRNGGSSDELAIGFTTFGTGTTYLSGYFKSSTIDLNPGVGTYNSTLIGSQDGFLQKISPDGLVIIPQINISASQTTICPTTTQISYTATTVSGNPNETFQWKKNGINVGSNSSVYLNSAPNSGDQVYCVLTSNGFTVSSNTITINTSAVVSAEVNLTVSQSTICAETNEIDYFATVQNGGYSTVYQWYKNGILVNNNSPVYEDTLMSIGDQVYVMITSNASCASPNTATSNLIIISGTNGTITPVISISASQSTICGSTSAITYSASASNFGTSATYQWYKNNLPVGISNLLYVDNSPVTGDEVHCVLTGNASCTNTASTTSNSILLTYTSSSIVPTISISASQTSICASTTQVVYTASATNGGANPIYQWYKNGVAIGTNSVNYIQNSPVANDVVYCKLTSNANCVNNTSISSNILTLSFSTSTINPSVTISGAYGINCLNSSVTFFAQSVNSGTNPQFVWKKNGTIVGGNSAIYNCLSIQPNDIVLVEMQSNATCNVTGIVSSSIVYSNEITWTGLIDSDWHKPCNWSPQALPLCCNNILIPLTINQPIVNGVTSSNGITIYSTNGALLTVNAGANVQIADCPIGNSLNVCPSASIISTTAISGITQTSAISGGSISYSGISAVIDRGICWSTSPNPTLSNNFVSNGIGSGNFVSTLTGLTVATTYYVRAFAINSGGTTYGNQLSFIISANVPTITSGPVSLVSSSSVSASGTISSDNGSSVTARGVCWSTSPNPTISNSLTNNGSGIGYYASSITGLNGGTTYYLRAYATNSIGTSYGNEISFTTSTPFLLSGGIESSLGAETLMTFNNSGTLTVTGTGSIRVLVVGGGGGGKSGKSNNGNTGGGGGKVIEQYLTLNPGTYSVTIGNGGAAAGGNGTASVISGVTQSATGGLGNGNSGAGFIVGSAAIDMYAGGTCYRSGTGAGASANGNSDGSGVNGPGIDNNITGTSIQYGYGGGSGAYNASLSSTPPNGNGSGYISYNNGSPIAVNASPNAQNRGHGGNGGGNTTALSASSSAGSKGVIIIRYSKIL
jgi:hypothetical protein